MVEAVQSFLVLQVATNLPDVVPCVQRCRLIRVTVDQAEVRHVVLRERLLYEVLLDFDFVHFTSICRASCLPT